MSTSVYDSSAVLTQVAKIKTWLNEWVTRSPIELSWTAKKTPYVNVWIKQHHLLYMPSCVTRWWTLWNIFGQITLHCSNHLVDEREHLYYPSSPCLTSSCPSSSTLSASFSSLCLCQLEQSLSCHWLDLSRLWSCLRLKLWGTWSCKRQSSAPSWPGQ